MSSVVLLIIIFICSILSILFLSTIARKINLVDIPNERKIHTGKIPLIGGLAIYINLILFIFLKNDIYFFDVIILTSFIVILVGLVDDLKDIGITIRLIFLLITSLIIIGSGLSITNIGNYYYFNPIQLGIFGILLTVLSVVGLTNAINFLDGIDGLSSGTVLVSLTSIIIYGKFFNQYQDYEILYVLICILLVFLFFNFGVLKKFKVFLGDSGSILIGFILSWLLIYYSHPDVNAIHPVLTLWCVSLPVYDLIGVVIKRIINKKNPFRPDRSHIHHLLIQYGLSNNQTFFIIIFFNLLFTFIGAISFYFSGPLETLLLFFIILLLYTFLNYKISIKIKNISL